MVGDAVSFFHRSAVGVVVQRVRRPLIVVLQRLVDEGGVVAARRRQRGAVGVDDPEQRAGGRLGEHGADDGHVAVADVRRRRRAVDPRRVCTSRRTPAAQLGGGYF